MSPFVSRRPSFDNGFTKSRHLVNEFQQKNHPAVTQPFPEGWGSHGALCSEPPVQSDLFCQVEVWRPDKPGQ